MQKRILLACILAFFPVVTFAYFNPVVTLTSGMARANVYSSKSILLGAYPNTYVGTNHYDTSADTGLFVGGETVFSQNWAWQVGVSYFQNSSFIESGNVYQFSDPTFNNLTYQYQIQSRRISLDTKMSHISCKIWYPYISASLGKAFNSAYSYTEYPVTTADVPMTQPFSNHTKKSFAYSAGFGIDVNLTDHVRIGAGYRFANLGSASLGMSPLQNNVNTISNAHLYTHELLAQISYIG